MIWNESLTKEKKETQFNSMFLRKTKAKLLESDNERKYFQVAYNFRVTT